MDKFTYGQVQLGNFPTIGYPYPKVITFGTPVIRHLQTPLEESDVMTSDEHDWLVRIEAAIGANNVLLHNMNANGCAKAHTHDDHERRIRVVENQQAESRGKMVMLSGVISVIAVIIGKLFK